MGALIPASGRAAAKADDPGRNAAKSSLAFCPRREAARGMLVDRRQALGLIAAGGALIALAPARAATIAPPLRPLRYQVFVDGSRSGTEDVDFVSRPQGFTATSALSIRVNVAFITAYRYQQDGQQDWQNGKLLGFEYLTNDDGAVSRVAARRDGDRFVVNGPKGEQTAPGDVNSSGFWYGGILKCSHLIDPQTAELVPLAVQPLAAKSTKIGRVTVHGRGYAIQTFLQGTVWYDEHELMVAATFGKDGHQIALVRIS